MRTRVALVLLAALAQIDLTAASAQDGDAGVSAEAGLFVDAGPSANDAAAGSDAGGPADASAASEAGLARAVPVQAAPAATAVEVTVRGQRSEARRLQESAEAVTVVDTKRAKQQTADLGEVLARTQGVGVRRDGGLGSNAIISLNGLQGDQVRLFLDGVPLEVAGFPFGLVNIPVNLVDRVEIYRGVVPLRFGADALGGAINVVTDTNYDSHLGGSYQAGSFGTHRATVNGRYHHAATGVVVGGAAFVDAAKNDFWMHDRELAADDGSTILKNVRRFHDAYRAYGGNVELGVVDQKWAKRLLVQGFFSTYDKQVQHNAVMSYPFGEITRGETIAGATARYNVDLRSNLELEAVANYAHRIINFEDLSRFVYSWDGTTIGPVGRNDARGILPGAPLDKSTLEDTLFGRLGLNWTLAPGHILRASATSSMTMRTGDDHVKERTDLLHLDEAIKQLVTGAEYELNMLDERLANEAFVKGYFFAADGEDRRQGTANIFTRHRRIQRAGGGDALRFRFTPWLLAKASYEYAIRLPRADELFGDGALIEKSANSKTETPLLKPERSHNVNVGPRLDLKRTLLGDFMLDVNWFLRDSKDMIVLLAGENFIPYSNISDARTSGVESAWSWVSPGRWLSLEGSFTWQDVRNTSTSGPFALRHGQRVPSRPWMFASWGARIRIPNLPGSDDTIEPFYYGRYVHEFSRGWAIGDAEFRTGVAKQIGHSVGLTWLFSGTYGKLGCTFEVSNVSDARLYDVFGVERPGRAFYLKLSGQL